MKKTVLATATAAAFAASGQIYAETEAEKIERLEQEMQILRDAYLEGAPQRIRRIADTVGEKKASKGEVRNAWYDKIELGALIEVETGYADDFDGNTSSDIVVSTFAPYITSHVTDWISLEASLLYEEDDTPLEMDIGTITVANREKSAFYSIIGQTYMPFGNYSTEMISDPLTLEIGETRETAIQLGIATSGFNAGVFTFNGNVDKNGEDKINSFGAALSYGAEFDDVGIGLGISYINNLGDSDGLQEGIVVSDRVPGVSVNASLSFASLGLFAEYLGAADQFDPADFAYKGEGAQPTAYNLEANYSFNSFNKESIFAIGIQGSDESVALELPEQRILAAYRVFYNTTTTGAIEYAYDKDYAEADGGTGNSGSSLTAQLSVVF